MTVTYHLGDTRDVTATFPDGSVSLIATSPPFLCLRSYLPADHPHKHAEIGSEPDPATFLDTLLALTAEWGRVLAPWGSIAVELGDTYTGAGGYGSPESLNPAFSGPKRDQHFEGRTARRFKTKDDGWPLAKSLALIPQLYATSLAYGRNLLTGRESPAGRWRVRNVIVWHRPNPAVGALGDKFRPSTSYIVVATRSNKRWFDLTAVRTDHVNARPQDTNGAKNAAKREGNGQGAHGFTERTVNPAGAPPLDCWFDTWDGSHDTWTVTTQPSSLSHYAMWPAKLAERLILSMCPAEVCTACGTPRRRVERTTQVSTGRTTNGSRPAHPDMLAGGSYATRTVAQAETLGWTDCWCGTCSSCGGDGEVGDGWHFPRICEACGGTGRRRFMPGVVLDPFAGTGTTLAVADLHGRDAIGVDIDSRNRDLYPARREEVARSLFGTKPELPGQLDMFGGDT